MKRKVTLLRRLCSLLLAGILCVGLLPFDGVMTAYADDSYQTMVNVVIFARLNGDPNDDVNKPGNWDTIKRQYIGGNVDGYDNSFTKYIETVSGGRVHVQNLFPQEEDGKINVLQLSQSSYTETYQIIAEVVHALEDAQNNPDSPLYIEGNPLLDNRDKGVLDNLTVILQGSKFAGSSLSSKGNYAGTEEINGVRVGCYNAIPLGQLITTTAMGAEGQIGGVTQQGVLAHEFLHTMGLPDLYRSGGNGDPVGIWDIMGSVPRAPQYPLGYQRKVLGWLDAAEIQEVTRSGDYELKAVDGTGGVKLITIKTPLSESASEMICLEYRRRSTDYLHFEYFLPASGLIMYRVNDAVPDKTNFAGSNYIYVYRPDVTTAEGATDTKTINGVNQNSVYAAALSTNGASYGSTDLSADYKQNTLYYSSGRNSGVQISNLQISGDIVKFHIEFAGYDDSWQGVGDAATTDAKAARLYADEAGNALYFACVSSSKQLYVKQWSESSGAWQPLGGAVGAASEVSAPSLAACGGKLYVAYVDGNGMPFASSWDGKAWSAPQRISNDSYPGTLQLVTDGAGVYAAYQNGSYDSGRRIVICELNGKVLAASPMKAKDFSNPTIVKDGSKFYIAYTKFMEKQPAQIDSYDTATGKWESVYTYSAASGSTNTIVAKNGRLYAAAGSPASAENAGPALAVWDGTKWTETKVTGTESFYEMDLIVAGQTPYLSFTDTTAGKAWMLRLSGRQWENCYDGLNVKVNYFEAANIGTQVYVALNPQNTNTVNVYRQKVTLAPGDPTDPNQPVKPADPVTPPPTDPVTPPTDPVTPPATQSPTLSLTPPSGYTDTKIYVDGVAYSAQKSGGKLTVQLPNTNGKIATMYIYKENGAPNGMYVWRLNFSGNTCTATALPGLQNLISYHGFSIRVQSPAGIRFKSGIDTGTRAQLLAGGVDGYRLKEYGTMSMAASNLGQYPFVLGESKVRTGQSYWTENGVVNDRVLETVSGRCRFASVIINIPQQQYASDIAFRAYVILQDASGREVTVYGPYVTRSVYTVAQQVAAAGEFKPGSSGYQYVQGIIQAAKQ